jgi:sensor histidine kinase YesM
LLKNSTNGVIQKRGSQLVSSKKGAGHGIGIKRIDEVTEKYDGNVKREHENNTFITTIILPVSTVPQLQIK